MPLSIWAKQNPKLDSNKVRSIKNWKKKKYLRRWNTNTQWTVFIATLTLSSIDILAVLARYIERKRERARHRKCRTGTNGFELACLDDYYHWIINSVDLIGFSLMFWLWRCRTIASCVFIVDKNLLVFLLPLLLWKFELKNKLIRYSSCSYHFFFYFLLFVLFFIV